MGISFRKFMRTPVAVDSWKSLQREAHRIHDSLVEFIKEPVPFTQQDKKNRNQRFIILNSQWRTIYSLLHNYSTSSVSSNADGDYTTLISEIHYEWLQSMQQKMQILLSQFHSSSLSSISEE